MINQIMVFFSIRNSGTCHAICGPSQKRLPDLLLVAKTRQSGPGGLLLVAKTG